MTIEALEDRLLLAEDLAPRLSFARIDPAASHPAPTDGDLERGRLAGHRPILVRAGHPFDSGAGARGGHRGLVPAGSAFGRPVLAKRRGTRPRTGVGAGQAAESAFRLPGQAEQPVSASFTLTGRDARYRNEVGLFLVDDASGRLGALRPGDPGYAAEALARRRVLFERGQEAGATAHLDLPGGSYFGTYLVQGSTSGRLLARNPGNRPGRRPLAFFSFTAANADRSVHVRLPSSDVLAMEYLWRGGDRDFNDAVIRTSYMTVGGIMVGAPDEPPVVTILEPPDGALTNREVIVTGRVTDDHSDVASLKARFGAGPVALDGEGAGPLVDVAFDRSSGAFSLPAGLALDGSADGPHTIHFLATDGVGNTSLPADVAFTLDVTAPTVVLTSPAPDLLTNAPVTVLGRVADDLSGVARLEAQVDAGPFTPLDHDAAGNFSLPTGLPLDGSADGMHIVRFRATDGAGNVSGLAAISFTLDTRPPNVSIQDPAPGLTTPTNVTIAGITSDALSGVAALQAQVDSGPSFGVAFDPSSGGFSLPTTLPLDGSADGPHTVHLMATDRAGNVGRADFTFTLATSTSAPPCDFSGGLAGWTVDQLGGMAPGQGSVAVEGTDAVLREGNSFNVTLSKTFVVPAAPSVVSFMYDDLAFDTTSTGLIKDAFEAALVDGSGKTLVHTIGAGRDAFFNITEGLPAALGSEASVQGQTVTLSLAGVTPGTTATLILRLVNNDSDTDTSVHITCASFPPVGIAGATKFYVADGATIFRYAPDGSTNGSFGLAGAASNPRGVASNAVGDTLWTIDGTTHEVAVEAPDGARRGAWTVNDLVRPEGIATDGTDLWIVDAGSGIVRHYAGAAARTSGSIAATDSFPLDPANSSPSDLATDGTTIWVTDDIRDEVFVY